MMATSKFEGYKRHLDDQPLVRALWWFIENINHDDPDRTELFFYLRARVINGV
jgi:hypothetical protein